MRGQTRIAIVSRTMAAAIFCFFAFSLVAQAAPSISSFSPSYGPVGTQVTINGSNFAATASNNNVRFNGVLSGSVGGMGSTRINAVVPSGATTGPISVTYLGQTGTSANSFRVTGPPPTITSFTPSGPPGSTMTIAGTNFSTYATAVYFTDASGPYLDIGATPTSITATSLTVVVPSGIASGPFRVITYDAGGETGRVDSTTNFIVTVPTPTITSFSPTVGPVGTQVAINGTNFDYNTPANNAVLFNGTAAAQPTVDASGTVLTATVPNGATTGPITVMVNSSSTQIAGASVTSSSNYTVGIPPPTITSFTPTNGIAGTLVTISGTHFGATQGSGIVQLAGNTINVASWSDTAIAVTIPSSSAGVPSGPFTVALSSGQSVTSSGSFTVRPAISSFSPSSGPVGTTVTIAGSGFSTTPASNTVTFNGVAATVASATGTSLTVTVPSAATAGAGPIAVTVSGNTATSGSNFTVIPGVTGFSPSSGAGGTAVTITGTNFSATAANNTVKFNGVAATVTSATTTSLSTSVPIAATTGPVSVTVNGLTGTSASNFTVPAPTISSFSPTSGPRGSTVTITGTNFSPSLVNNAVSFTDYDGTTIDVSAAVTAVTATTLTVTVPNAVSGKFTVYTPAGHVTSSAAFTVTVPKPTISSFTPTIGPVGTVVTINGTNFDSATPANNVVSFNGGASVVASAATSTSLTVTVPSNATTGPIAVTVNSGMLYIGSSQSDPSTSNYTVGYPQPTITSFTPTSGGPGTRITITGTNFNTDPYGAASVAMGSTPVSVLSWADTSIQIQLPSSGSEGSYWLSSGPFTVTTRQGLTATSAQSFQYNAPPPPPLSITRISPAAGPFTTIVTIWGTGFSSARGGNKVTFSNGVVVPDAKVTPIDSVHLQVEVPAAAQTGPITVTVGTQSATSPTYTVVPSPALSAQFMGQVPFNTAGVANTIAPGATGSVAIQFRNTGTTTWTSAQNFKLGQTSTDWNWTSSRRASLSTSVAPGDYASISFTITAPSTPGYYTFCWMMLQDNPGNPTWFGDMSCAGVYVGLPTDYPNAPASLSATATASGAALSWAPPASGTTPTRYHIAYRFDASGPWYLTADVPGAQTSFNLGLSFPPRQYYFGVAACTDGDLCSAYTAFGPITAPAVGTATCKGLSVTPSVVSFPASGGSAVTLSLTVPEHCVWSITSTAAGWLNVSPLTGTDQTTTITLTPLGPNTSSADLTGTLTVSGQDASVTIAVSQAGSAASCSGLIATPSSVSFPISGGAGQNVTISAPASCNWSASTTSSWFTMLPTSGSGNGVITLTPNGANTTSAVLTGTVTIAGSGVTAQVAVSQATQASPQLATAPPTDTVSDSVGATAGQFAVDAGGSASYHISIYTPHGAGGLTPGLALSYNSGGGEGAAGVGWQLEGESAISVCRKTQEHGDGLGVSQLAYTDPAKAAYCLDGQRLMLMSGTNGAVGATYRTENDLFARVTIETADTTNGATSYTVPTTWLVQNKDGSSHRYGGTDTDTNGLHRAQLAWKRPADNAVFTKSWYRYEIKDTNGNAIHYTYSNMATTQAAWVALSSVSYTGGTITFANQASGSSANCSFGQPISYQGGIPVQRKTLLGANAIKSGSTVVYCGGGSTSADIAVSSGGTLLRNYKLTYQHAVNNPAQLQLTQIQECDGSSPQICYAPTVFNWADASAWSASATNPGVSVLNGNHEQEFWYTLSNSMHFGDINGDGRSDAVFLYANSTTPNSTGTISHKHVEFRIGFSDPSKDSTHGGGFSSFLHEGDVGGTNCLPLGASGTDAGTPVHNTSCPEMYKFLDFGNSYQLIDFNGDGKDDLLLLEPTKDFEDLPTQFHWVVWLSDGTKFTSKITNISASPFSNFNGGGYGSYFASDGTVGPSYVTNPTCSAPPCEMPLVKDPAGNGSVHSHSNAMQIADLDGDGLPDAFVLNDKSASVWLFKPNTTGQQCTKNDGSGTVACPYLFQGPYNVVIDMPTGSAPCPIGDFTLHQLRVADFNGDGKADILLKEQQACAAPNNPAASDEYLQIFTAVGIGSDGAYHFAPGYAWPHNTTYQNADLFQIADFNGDGLPDIAYASYYNSSQDGDDQQAAWSYQLNAGDGTFTSASCVTSGCTQINGPFETQFGDYDGDGKADFIAPVWRTTSPPNLQIYLWSDSANSGQGGFVPQPFSTAFEAPDIGSSIHNLYSYLVDLDGDGYPDQLMTDPTSDGQFNTGGWQITRSSGHHQPRNLITSIRSGLGATTQLTYGMVTYSSLYYREYNGYTLSSGYGSPVQDTFAPRWVVQLAESTAPTESAPAAMSAIRYRYAGQKIQGGGRGSLGFHKVYSTDEQTGITTVTFYNQAYPFTGTPIETIAYQDGPFTAACDVPSGGNPDTPACMQYGVQSDGLAGKSILSDSRDTFTAYWQDGSGTAITSLPLTTPTTPTPLFVARTGSAQLKYGLDSTLLSAQQSVFTYTGGNGIKYGELQSSTVTDYASATSTFAFSTPVRTTTTAQQYGGDDDTKWYMGRLSQSTTTVTGGNTDGVNGDTISRTSKFEYDTTTGQLIGEHLQQGAGKYQEVDRYHFHDSYGNETEVDTCSLTGNCTTTAKLSTSPSSIVFNPTDDSWVQRYARSDFSATGGIYANAIYAPFSNGSGGATEIQTLSVNSRDPFGTPIDTTDAHGVRVTTATNTLGRAYFSASNIGAATQTIYRWCSTGLSPYVAANVPSANQVPCPGNAVYRVQTDSSVGTSDGSSRSPATWTYYDSLGRVILKLQQGFATTQTIAVATAYDNLGRTTKTTEPYFTYAPSSSQVGQNADATLTADPNCLNAPYCSKQTYDILGRVVDITHPNGSTTTTSYRDLDTQIVSPKNGSNQIEKRWKTQNHLGQVVTITDVNVSTLTNTYDPSGNVRSVTRSSGGLSATSTMGYDILGRKTSLDDFDAGSWTYTYNAFGEQLTKASASTCTATRYDGQGRTFSRNDYANATCTGTAESTAGWTYDGSTATAGLLKTATGTDNGVTETQVPSYDSFGRVFSVATTLGAMHYTQRTTYDPYGRGYQGFFSGDGIAETGELTVYNALGYPYQTRDAESGLTGTIYQEVTAMDARGHVTTEQRANGHLSTSRSYDTAMGWLTKIASSQTLAASPNPAAIQNLVYQYDALGNVVLRKDTSPGTATNEYSCYDNLQRLVWQGNTGSSTPPCSSTPITPTPLPAAVGAPASTAASVGSARLALYPAPLMTTSATALPAGVGTQNTYDAFGNIISNGQFGYVYASYSNSVCAGLGGVSAAGVDAVTQANGLTYCYDARGNQIASVDSVGNAQRTATYTSYDALRTVSSTTGGHTTRWTYGIGRERAVREDAASSNPATTPSAVTHYLGSAEIQLDPSTKSAAVQVKRYLGGLILTQTIGSGTSYGYLFTDNLGSTHRITDENGNASSGSGSSQAYTAFGARASTNNGTYAPLDFSTSASFDTSLTHHGYTGHEMMDEVGLIHMNGRVYDANLQRFAQADPFVQDAGNLQSFNRYSYVLNNPLATTDPTGYWGHRQQGYLRTVGAIVITAFGGWAAAPYVAAGETAEAAVIVVAAGTAAGYVQTGNVKGAVLGGVEAGLDFGIGQTLNFGSDYTSATAFENYGAHAALGGVMAVLRGGKFGHGFVTAGIGAALDPHYDSNIAAGTIEAAVVGGTVSKLTGGKFANGAVTAAFEFAFNQELAAMRWNDAVRQAIKEGRQDELKVFEGPAIVVTAVAAAPVAWELYWAALANPATATSIVSLAADGAAGGATGGASLVVGAAGIGNVAKRVFTSSDPLVGELATKIDAAYPGLVVGVNVPVRNAAGQLVTDADILLQNAVVQVKSGGGKGLASQLQRTEQATGLPAIGYGPDLKPSILRSCAATNCESTLIEVLKP